MNWKQVISWIERKSFRDRQAIKTLTTEEILDWDEIPFDVREIYLQRQAEYRKAFQDRKLVKRVVIEEILSWDKLPEDVREAYLNRQETFKRVVIDVSLITQIVITNSKSNII